MSIQGTIGLEYLHRIRCYELIEAGGGGTESSPKK